MIFNGWYTDSVEVWRDTETVINYITTQARTKQGTHPCRVYKSDKSAPVMSDREARIRTYEKLACELGTDIKPGDELIVTRGGALGATKTTRYFAGEVMPYYEPVGGMFNGLGHIEVGLLENEAT